MKHHGNILVATNEAYVLPCYLMDLEGWQVSRSGPALLANLPINNYIFWWAQRWLILTAIVLATCLGSSILSAPAWFFGYWPLPLLSPLQAWSWHFTRLLVWNVVLKGAWTFVLWPLWWLLFNGGWIVLWVVRTLWTTVLLGGLKLVPTAWWLGLMWIGALTLLLSAWFGGKRSATTPALYAPPAPNLPVTAGKWKGDTTAQPRASYPPPRNAPFRKLKHD